MTTAYLDAEGNVLGCGDIPLREYRKKWDERATKAVEGAPNGLIHIHVAKQHGCQHHRLRDGAEGHYLDDYDVVDDLTELRAHYLKTIDDQTKERILGGSFEWPAASGQFFSLTQNAQLSWQNLMLAKDALDYPVRIRTKDDKAECLLNSAEDVTLAFTEMVRQVQGYRLACQKAKAQLLEATTKAELERVVPAGIADPIGRPIPMLPVKRKKKDESRRSWWAWMWGG